MTYRIKKEVLESIMEFSKNFYPNEFSGLLDCEDEFIRDIYILPGTKSGPTSAVLRTDLAPMTFSLCGSVHSHPSGNGYPSHADLNFFRSKKVNIIAFFPFDISNYKAYNQNGELIFLEIV